MKQKGNWRIFFLAGTVIAVGGIIILRLFFIQVRDHDFYRALAAEQHRVVEELSPDRGEIFFQDLSKRGAALPVALVPAAMNKAGYFAFAVPRDVPKDTLEQSSAKVASVLALDSEVIIKRIGKRGDPYEPLKRKLSDEEADALVALGIPGVRLGKETWRSYPAKNLAATLLGYVGVAGGTQKGLYGIERYYQEMLAGVEGYRAAERDALGLLIPFRIREQLQAQDGKDLVLTIDANVQFVAQRVLSETLEKWDSPGGLLLVLEPQTGKILALASEPTYDPNSYNEVDDISVFLNPAVEKVFEPGSVFKPITMSAALEEKLVTPHTTYTDEGVVRIGGYAIHNFDDKAYGVRTMTEVIELSLNTGAVYAQRLLGRERFTAYVKAFGFGEKTGVDLPGEVGGSIRNLAEKPEINFATASFGQGISATPLQMANAVAAIANGGMLMQPYVVEKIINADDTERVIEPKQVRRVLNPEAARSMTRMLVDAVRGKFEWRAGVEGYFVAGKTGTAQIPDPKGGGYLPVSEGVVHTFVGYAPAFSPRFLVFIKMDKPVGVRFSATSLTPAFHDMAVYLLNYLNVPPDEAVQQ